MTRKITLKIQFYLSFLFSVIFALILNWIVSEFLYPSYVLMASAGIGAIASFGQLHALIWGGLGITILPAMGFAIYLREKIPIRLLGTRILWSAIFAWLLAMGIAYLIIPIYATFDLRYSHDFATLLAAMSSLDKIFHIFGWFTYFSCWIVEPIDGWLLLLALFYIWYLVFVLKSVKFR